MIISRTPFRISFFGGGTDYPAWYRDYGGAVLATTIDKYCYISCRYLPPFFEHRSRIVYSKVETVSSNDQVEHPAVRGVLNYLGIHEGVEIHHNADLPARTGLGSSSVFTVGLLHALHGLRGRHVSKRQLVDEAIRVEQDILKEHVGSQDQVIAAYGGLNRIEFNPNGDIHVNPIPLTLERRNALEAHLMLVYSGISRTASEIAKAQVEATKRLTRQLRLIYEQVDQAIDLLQNGTDLQAFGELLHEGWMLKQSLTEHISTPSIDQLYERARAAGAIGGKLLGAGGGGFVLLFAKPEDQPVIQERLSGFLCVPFRFEQSGSRIIFYESETWPPQRGLARPVAEAVSSSPRAGT